MNETPLTPLPGRTGGGLVANHAPAGGSGFAERIAALPLKLKVHAALGVLALAAVLAAMTAGSRGADHKVLFANLSAADGGAIVERLAQMNVPYRIAEGSGTILVPAAQVHELRLKLSAAGLPKGSITGYELLDKTPFGQTQGQERISVQRALEGELTRTIQSLASVQSARVHLALPAQNGFFREQQKPSASVVLALHPGRTLDAAQLSGIVHLVAASVPELSAKAVSVLDGSGALLSGPADADAAQGLDSKQLQYRRDVEAAHLARVMELLEPVVGRENLRATVSAEIDFSQSEQTSEEWKPNQGAEATAAVRAMRTEELGGGAGAAAPSGVPGAVSNQPAAAASAPVTGPAQVPQAAQANSGGAAGAAGAAGSGRREAETRYELDKTVRVVRNATGNVTRLAAAVVVNHRTTTDPKGKSTTAPLPAEELEKLTALVREAIGFQEARGDTVRVINAPFRAEPAATAEPVPLWRAPWLLDLLQGAAAPLALAVTALVIVFALLRPAVKAIAPPPPPPAPAGGLRVDEVIGGDTALPAPGAAALPGAAGEGGAAVGGVPASIEAPGANAKLEAARALAKQNPAAVASIVRGWVAGANA
jgi:flagellar M-ring protein FliF